MALARIINDAAQRQAPVLIPAFAVGRTQEIVYLIRELEDENAIPVLPVTVDSPMAAATTAAYAKRKEEHDEEYASILTQQKHPLRTRSMTTASSRAGIEATQRCEGRARDHQRIGNDDGWPRFASRVAAGARSGSDRSFLSAFKLRARPDAAYLMANRK